MAPLPVITDVYRCTLKWHHTDLGTDAVNVMHFYDPSTNPATLAADWDTHVTAAMWNAIGNHAHVVELDITPLDGSSTTFPFVTGSPAKWSGAISATNAPIVQAAAILKLVTNKRGRSYRGRVYLPWINEDANTNGVLDSGYKAAMQAAWTTFVAAMQGDGHHLAVASYKLATSENVVALGIESYVATQRRRLKRTSST